MIYKRLLFSIKGGRGVKLNSHWIRAKWDGSAHKQTELIRKEKQLLLQEIRDAHKNWLSTQAQFDFALGKDQIDYAIYCLEAAEKRYEMLLKQAKELHFSLQDRDVLPEVKQWSSSM
jgi:hypothetical protein